MNKSKIVVVTLATHCEGYYEALESACKRSNIRFVTLAWGEKWKGYAWKFHSMKRFLLYEPEAVAKESIYIFVDGFDVIPNLETEANAIKHFYSVSEGKMIVGLNSKPRKGKFLDMFQSWLDREIFGLCLGKSLNSGVYGGTRDQIIQFLDLSALEGSGDNDDDQRMLLRSCNKNTVWFSENVHFDEEGLFALNVTCAIASSSRDRLAEALHNTKPPLFFHGAGGCAMDSISKSLGLPPYRKILKSNRSTIQRVFGNDGYARYAIRSPRIMSVLFILLFASIISVILCVKFVRDAFKSAR
jgi:hypothetical protein